MPDATVVEVRDLPLDLSGSRTLVVRWSDGSTSEAVRFYADEVLFSEEDLVNKTPGGDSRVVAGARRGVLRRD